MTRLEIIKYELIEQTVKSSFTFRLINNNSIKIYILEIPSNPLVDIDILHLNNKHLVDIINKLNKIIKNGDYSYKTSLSLQKFLDWIIKNINSNNELII